uniref:Uncharacterized protein n=1 Tax=Acrobeloides nanus TaxID=290746 RepID=A0A914DBZ4_9BILA
MRRGLGGMDVRRGEDREPAQRLGSLGRSRVHVERAPNTPRPRAVTAPGHPTRSSQRQGVGQARRRRPEARLPAAPAVPQRQERQAGPHQLAPSHRRVVEPLARVSPGDPDDDEPRLGLPARHRADASRDVDERSLGARRRERSLGWLAVWWMETFTVHGPGDIVGQPTRFGDEYTGFIVDAYAVDDTGRRLYDSAFLSRPKGCDKSGLAGKFSLFEAFGPARFSGWAQGGETYEFLGQVYTYRRGEPMGRTVTAPMVRILATEEEQTGNTYGTIYHNLTSSESPLFSLQAWGVIAGLSQVVIPGGGMIKRSTSGASSKDGGLETFVVFDETHLYNTPQLREMYNVVRDNLGKRAANAEPWFIETTTMFAPGEESVAEKTFAYADAIEEKRARRTRLLFDHRWGEVKDLADEAALAEAFREAYGDAIEWNPVEALIDKAYDPR